MKTFEYSVYDAVTNKMIVSLNGHILGYIRASAWGWFFTFTNESPNGKLFKDISSIKRALEDDITLLFKADEQLAALECGCLVMKGWRCQFHGAP